METLSDIVVFQTLPDGSLLTITKFSKLLDTQLFAGLLSHASFPSKRLLPAAQSAIA